MASSQQQKLPPTPPPPQPQKQNVTVCSKVHPNKYLGIKHGSVKLVDSAEIWEKVVVEVKVEVIHGVEVEVEVFLLKKDGDKALAHGNVPGAEVYLAPDSSGPIVHWTQIGINDNNEFKHISTPILNLDVVQRCGGTKIEVNIPNGHESQLWKTSQVVT